MPYCRTSTEPPVYGPLCEFCVRLVWLVPQKLARETYARVTRASGSLLVAIRRGQWERISEGQRFPLPPEGSNSLYSTVKKNEMLLP
jgi:hypothetical protein